MEKYTNEHITTQHPMVVKTWPLTIKRHPLCDSCRKPLSDFHVMYCIYTKESLLSRYICSECGKYYGETISIYKCIFED